MAQIAAQPLLLEQGFIGGAWVDAGAPAQAAEVVEQPASAATHWAFRPVKRPAEPRVLPAGGPAFHIWRIHG